MQDRQGNPGDVSGRNLCGAHRWPGRFIVGLAALLAMGTLTACSDKTESLAGFEASYEQALEQGRTSPQG